MKKGRLGTLLTILADDAQVPALEDLLLRETSTLGVRIHHERRSCLDRAHTTVTTPYGDIRIKIGSRNGEIFNAAPEFEDCRAAAAKHNVPVKQVSKPPSPPITASSPIRRNTQLHLRYSTALHPRRSAAMERRDFLKTATAAGIAAAIPATTQPPSQRATPIKRPESPDMIYRELGTTGERVSAIGMGGYHLGKQSDANESINLMHAGIDRGITFLDNCWDYNDGISEVRMGQALRNGYREKVFLMTKMDGRTASRIQQATRTIPRPPSNRHDRPRPVPRSHPHGRPRPHLRPRRSHRSRHRRTPGRKNPLHRFHRTQRSRRPPPHARDRAKT